MEPARSTNDFTRTITVADGNNIVAVLDLAAINSEYQIFEQDYVVKFQAVLEDLKVTVGLMGLAEAPWPEINALMSESQKMAEIGKVRTQGQKISLQLYTAKGNGPWVYQSKIVLQNQGGEETHVPILVPFLSSNETLLVGGDFKLGARIEPIWNQPLKANDYLVIKGTWRQIVSFSKKKDDDVEFLAARIEALELALNGKLTELPPNTLLGRGGTQGTVQIIPQNTFAKPADIDTAIFNLIGAAPAALNTLDELANAIADDQNFAATITNQLSLKSNNSFPTSVPAEYSISVSTALNIPVNTWYTVGTFNNLGFASTESVFVCSVYIQFGDGTNTYGHWQYHGACILTCIQWKAGGSQLSTSCRMEAHSGADFNCSVRFALGNVNRQVQISFDIPMVSQSPSLLRIKLKRIF